MKIKVKDTTSEIFMKRAFWLAWQACGGTMGMGFLQDKPNASEEDVWKNVNTSGDYSINFRKKNNLYADYVFGRMMKWGGVIQDGIIDTNDRTFDPEYQGFSRRYANTKLLLDATAASLKCSYTIEEK